MTMTNGDAGSSGVSKMHRSASTMSEKTENSVAIAVHKPSHIETALVEAQRDLDNADFHLGFLFHPLRDIVVKPVLGIAAHVLPPVAVIPFADELTAFWLNIPFSLARRAYHATHSEQATAEWKTRQAALQEFQEFANTKIADEITKEKFALQSFHGFIISATIELVSDPACGLSQWMEYTRRLIGYIVSAGIGDELSQTINSDRYLLNVRILGNIMASDDNSQIRRIKTAIPDETFNISPKVVAKLMRYCCSAYGNEMMEAVDIIARRGEKEMSSKYRNMVGSEALKLQVCDHVGIPTNYITYFCMGHGGSMSLLRHYISTDHELGAVVLVIRGTHSVSDWHFDFQGQGKPFCGGMAHSGMAQMASALVENSRAEIISALKQYPGYRLIITGQSLGGGVSPLVNILCHMDPVIGKRKIKCHAFAGPPVYYSERRSSVIDAAISNCTHYVHSDDVVPYLGVHPVRRINAKLHAIDQVTKTMSTFHSELIAIGRKPPTRDLVAAAVYGDAHVKPVAWAPNLMTPAKRVVWFHQDDQGKVNFMVCDPKRFSELGILLSADGLDDHVPPKYEAVLNEAGASGWKQLRPP